jgi:hypothetical protein
VTADEKYEEFTYLLLTEKGEMQKNLKRFCVCREDDELGNTTVQGLRRCCPCQYLAVRG